MVNDGMDHPIWGPHVAFDGSPHRRFAVIAKPEIPGAARRQLAAALNTAEDLMLQRDYEAVVRILEPFANDGLARRILYEAAIQIEDPSVTLRILNPPQTDQERIAVMRALWDIGDRDALVKLIAAPGIADTADPAVATTRDLMARKLQL
jgi:hypothetical protein